MLRRSEKRSASNLYYFLLLYCHNMTSVTGGSQHRPPQVSECSAEMTGSDLWSNQKWFPQTISHFQLLLQDIRRPARPIEQVVGTVQPGSNPRGSQKDIGMLKRALHFGPAHGFAIHCTLGHDPSSRSSTLLYVNHQSVDVCTNRCAF